MTKENCLRREKVFREQGRLAEADFWLGRAISKGYKPKAKPKGKPKVIPPVVEEPPVEEEEKV